MKMDRRQLMGWMGVAGGAVLGSPWMRCGRGGCGGADGRGGD